MDGIILVNKEKNKTSRDMVNELCHIFNTKKIGHTGTLDPIATGILVVAIGRYTKLIDLLSFLEKEYIATIKLGIKTDTLDITGNILDERLCKVNKNDLLNVLNDLEKEIIYDAPMYSAKKVNGKKLYEYARFGEKVNVPKITSTIYKTELLDFNDDEFKVKFKVSKGTYIRSLIQIICDKLNVIGTMASLTRTMQGNFALKDSYSIDDIKNGNYKLLKINDVINIKTYKLNDEEYFKVKNGQKMYFDKNDNKILLTYNGKEIAIYEKKDNCFTILVMLDVN